MIGSRMGRRCWIVSTCSCSCLSAAFAGCWTTWPRFPISCSFFAQWVAGQSLQHHMHMFLFEFLHRMLVNNLTIIPIHLNKFYYSDIITQKTHFSPSLIVILAFTASLSLCFIENPNIRMASFEKNRQEVSFELTKSTIVSMFSCKYKMRLNT